MTTPPFLHYISFLSNTAFRFLCLGLGLLYLGKQERADVMLEAVRTVDHKRGRYAEITLNTCAYAGTGNVLKVITAITVNYIPLN
jgi:26S proteasome regulatory subunit N1